MTKIERGSWFVAALTFVLIVLGGIVRLTGSGLSITTWEPLTGAVPPLSSAEWERLFEAYRAIPEYRAFNSHLALDGFARLYWLEYAHRLIARLLALAVVVPAIWLIGKKTALRGL